MSPVTWQITHMPTALRSPGGPLHLAPPYQFAIDFTDSVDRAKVEAALNKNSENGHLRIIQWSSERRVVLAAENATGSDQIAIDPTGGMDVQGQVLKLPPDKALAASFFFWPAPVTALVAIDPASGKTRTVATQDQPYQTVSRSPDGSRLLLRRHVLTPGQSVGITGTAHLFEIATGRIEDLGIGGLFRHDWSRDGGLLIRGGCPQGSCVVWVAPGPLSQNLRGGSARLLYRSTADDLISDAHIAPTGNVVAIFSGKHGAPDDLRLIDLRPETAGRTITMLPGVAGATYGPSGLVSLPAAWSPDGRFLAFSDGASGREEQQPMKVWLIPAEGGKPSLLGQDASFIGPWSPDGSKLVLGGIGVVDASGQVLLPVDACAIVPPGNSCTGEVRYLLPGMVAWSPNGKLLHIGDAIYETDTWQVRFRTGEMGNALWSPDGQFLLAGGAHGGVYGAEGALLQPEARWISPFPRPFFSANSRWLYTPSSGVLDLTSGKMHPFAVPDPIPGLGEYLPIGFTADGQVLLALGREWER